MKKTFVEGFFYREKRWVIMGNCGLYVGQSLRRCDVIADHVSAKYGYSAYVRGGKLSPEQIKAWDQCKKNGDYAVKADILLDI